MISLTVTILTFAVIFFGLYLIFATNKKEDLPKRSTKNQGPRRAGW